MEQINNKTLLSQFSRYLFLKKTTQLLISVSFLSILLSKSSRFSFLHNFFNFYFSTAPFQLFTHTIDKKCIFLLCNGLVVFVAKFSGLISSSSSSSSKNSYFNNNIEIIKNYEVYEASSSVMDSKVTLLEKEENVISSGENIYFKDEEIILADEESHQEELPVKEEGNQESEKGLLIIEKLHEKESEVFVEENYQKEVVVGELFDDKFPVLYQEEKEEEEYEDEDDDDEENGMISTEELNKKFEEFIRKMKEEIRIEAQQQFVMVN